MRRLVIGSVLLWFMLLAAACGYISSGTWEDDPGNWKRAWGTAKPADVVIPHSWYRRKPHWKRKDIYFFQFRWNEKLFEQLIADNVMSPVGWRGDMPPYPDYCLDKPRWFAPAPAAAYEYWRGDVYDGIWLLREVETRELFFYLCNANGRASL